MRTQRTFLRRDLYRLVYQYSRAARQEGLDLEFAFGDTRRKGIYKNKIFRNGYFKRCPFSYIKIDEIRGLSLKILKEIKETEWYKDLFDKFEIKFVNIVKGYRFSLYLNNWRKISLYFSKYQIFEDGFPSFLVNTFTKAVFDYPDRQLVEEDCKIQPLRDFLPF